MNLIKTKSPLKWQKQDIILLQKACMAHDGVLPSFPMEEDCISYLLYNEGSLLSAFMAFSDGSGFYECYAATRPEERQKGCFSMVLKAFEEDAAEFDFIFPVNPLGSAAVKTLEAINASFWYQEHMMELTLPVPSKAGPDLLKTTPRPSGLTDPITITPLADFKEAAAEYSFFQGGRNIGSCHLEFRQNYVYFYGFEIKEDLRNQGMGASCLCLLLKQLSRIPTVEKVVLQVSGQNEAALALYKKTGFHIRESLSYYIY